VNAADPTAATMTHVRLYQGALEGATAEQGELQELFFCGESFDAL